MEAINPFQPESPAPADAAAQEHVAAPRSSEPALRAKAQLDAALTDLEHRGLLWWDRSSNSYDLHPIIRAYAHDQLEDTDRVQANERVRDHFEALPPEDPDRATSVEDLTQTITIFRALIGAGHTNEASALWASGLGDALVVELGAYATVVELLSPLAADGTPRVRSDLSIAYTYLGRYDAAISQDTSLLAQELRHGNITEIKTSLGNLAVDSADIGAKTAASRYLDLWAAVNAAAGDEADGNLCLARGSLTAVQGRVEQARELINQAEDFGSRPNYPWFEEGVEYWRLYLALVGDESLTDAQLTAAATRAHSWAQRRDLAELRCEFLIRQGQFEQALAATQERDQLGRNAGLDVAPARTAFLLAKLGRAGEATAAAEEALTRLPRIHPAGRPHYHLAQALRELGRTAEAAPHARDAYRQAWCDGPPYCKHWELRDARELLQTMSEPIPDLPSIDPASVKVPLEDEVRTFIATMEGQRQEDST